MNAFEWDGQFDRLMTQFRLPADVDADKVRMEMFGALQHWHLDAVERGITDVIRDAKETFFPPIGIVTEAIRTRMTGLDRTKDRCATCHGSGWIEAWPVMSWGLIYEMNQRCPDCGIPAPEMKKPHNARPLTRAEYDDWQEKRAHRDTMPEWAKPRKENDPNARNEIREFMSALRDRLFGHQDRYEP